MIRPVVSPPGLWNGQGLHYLALAILLVLVNAGWDYLDRPYPFWFWLAVSSPILHQIYVWLAWRLQLLSGLTERVLGFRFYLRVFFVLLASRYLTLLVLAWFDRETLDIAMPIRLALTLPLLALGGYAGYSVWRYFGFVRAAGADHFDARYRHMPPVNQGVFRITANGMYVFAFLLFWAIAIGFASSAALLVAAFSHVYIWIHFFATEKPDMAYLYENRTAGESYSADL